MITKAVILAAGEGKRLMPLTLAMPKEMIRVGVKPVIEHVIEVLKAGSIWEILIVVGRKKEAIMDYLGSGRRLGVEIYYRIQEEPKGTADAVYYCKDFIDSEDFVVVYGDNYFKPYEAMKQFIQFHSKSNADATLVLHPVDNPRRYGIVKVDDDGKVLAMKEKPSLKEARKYVSNGQFLSIAGLLILNHKIFDYIEKTKSGVSGEVWLTDSLELMRRDECQISGYVFEGRRYDIGTFESLLEADRMEQSEVSGRPGD